MASITKTTTSKGDTRWRVRYRDPDGKEREKWFHRKVDADRYARNVETDIDRGQYIDPQGGHLTFSDVSNRWSRTRTHLAQSTKDRDASLLRSLILPVFGQERIGRILPSDIEAWLADLDRASATRAKALQIVRSVLDLARRDGLIASNPAADIRPPKTRANPTGRALTDAQLDAVIQAAERVDPAAAPMVMLMARCGLRVGEAIALRRRDVNLDTGELTVSRSMSRREGPRSVKGRNTGEPGRTIPMPSDVRKRLVQHFRERPVVNIEGFLFTAPAGGPIRYTNWRRRVWRQIVDMVGFEVRPHDLRHSAATRLFIVDRWTPAEVQAFLGHRDPRVTLSVYTHVTAEDLPQPSALITTGRS